MLSQVHCDCFMVLLVPHVWHKEVGVLGAIVACRVWLPAHSVQQYCEVPGDLDDESRRLHGLGLVQQLLGI